MVRPVRVASHARHRRGDASKPGWELTKDLVFGSAALLGLLTVGWMLFAQVTGATVIYFRTGSMAPTLGQGAAAIAVPAEAADLEVGDVVTVRREANALPVTHRIVEINPVADRPQARELWLQGDDNAQRDMAPYVVTEAPRVVWGAAWFGALVLYLSQPWALGLVIGVIGLLVAWAFWPPPLDDEDEPEQAPDLPAEEREVALR